MEKVKKTSTKPIQQRARSLVLPGAIDGSVGELHRRWQIYAPGKEPDQIEQPEIKPRHRVVVARITQIEKSKQLLVNEEEPEKAVVFPRNALHREGEVGRISKRGEDVPGRGNEQDDGEATEWSKSLPHSRGEELASAQRDR